jgi:hypothetical protein
MMHRSRRRGQTNFSIGPIHFSYCRSRQAARPPSIGLIEIIDWRVEGKRT